MIHILWKKEKKKTTINDLEEYDLHVFHTYKKKILLLFVQFTPKFVWSL